MKNSSKTILKIIGFAILGIIVVIAVGFAVKLLWNWLMPDLFGFKEITYLQGMGILILAKIIFGFGGSTCTKKNECKNNEVIPSSNSNQDALYEKWWADEGEGSFEDYLKKMNQN